MANPHAQAGPSNSRSPCGSPRMVEAHMAGKSGSAGASSRSRTGPQGSNKTVAFSKPIVHGDSPLGSRSMQHQGPFPPGQHQSTLRVGPRLRAEGLMVPPASDAATLRRQVAALQIDLEAHIDGEQRLQCINQQLRERLELYMKQNHENVERAESELNNLHEDMEQTLELQRRLAERATALEKEKKEVEITLQKKVEEFETERTTLKARIQDINEDLKEKEEAEERVDQLQTELLSILEVKTMLENQLVAFAEEKDFLTKKADDYGKELIGISAKEQEELVVVRMGRKALMRRGFLNLEVAVREQCIDRANAVRAVRLYRQHGCRMIIYNLRMASYRSCMIRRAIERISMAAFQSCWKFWKLCTIARRRGKFLQQEHAVALVRDGMHAWVAYIIRLRLNPAQYVEAVDHWQHKWQKKYFKHWSWLVIQWRIPPKEEKHLVSKALKHYNRMLVHRHFQMWWRWLKEYAQPKREKFATVQAHINKMTLKQTVAGWRFVIHMNWVRRTKYEEVEGISRELCKRRLFNRWQDALREYKSIRLRITQAMQYREYRQAHIVIKCWRKFLQRQMHLRIYKQMAFRHYLQSLSISSMKTWRENVNFGKAQKRATTEVNQALTRAAMVFWRDYHVFKSIKKKQDYRASVYRKRCQANLVKLIMRWWWEQLAWKKKAIQLDILLAVRRRRSLQTQTLHAWMHATFDGLLLAHAKFHDNILLVQAASEEQKQQVTTVGVENLKLIDRLHSMSSEIASLKTTITDKEKQEENLLRAIEDGAVLESSMHGEVEQRQVRAEELELEIQSLQKRLQVKNAEDTAGEIHHTLEIQNLEQAVRELRTQLSDKASQMDCYEKALKETAERLEGASDQSQEKLTSAFEIAGSLRKLLEDREKQFATLEGNCRRREQELGEMQRKLAVANCTLCETVEVRDARIQELETMLSIKQQEVHESQQQLQDLELGMDLRETRVRKLEYELKLMSELQTASKQKKFVSNLSSWSATPQFNPDLHPLKVTESLRQTYCETMNTLQQQEQPSFEEQQQQPQSLESERVEDHQAMDQETRTIMMYQGQEQVAQPGCSQDWETSFALVSTTRPMVESGEVQQQQPQQGGDQQGLEGGGSGAAVPIPPGDQAGPFRIVLDHDPGAVDSLHVEIQRLQARIMSRLRDSAAPLDQDASNPSGASRATEPDPSSRTSWDS